MVCSRALRWIYSLLTHGQGTVETWMEILLSARRCSVRNICSLSECRLAVSLVVYRLDVYPRSRTSGGWRTSFAASIFRRPPENDPATQPCHLWLSLVVYLQPGVSTPSTDLSARVVHHPRAVSCFCSSSCTRFDAGRATGH